MNNLYQIEKNLRSIARRYKEVKFSISLAIIFLMLGVGAFGEEIIDSNIQDKNILTRSQIKESIKDIQGTFIQLKQKNDFLVKEANLELIQLMEQGDQVIKSPWSSWQFGMNYVSHNWSGEYKGRGDKEKNYPYEGIFTRSEDIFERYASSSSPNYKKVNKRNKLESYEYGITELKKEKEPITEWEISPNVNLKKIKEQSPFTLVLNHKVNFKSPSLPTFVIPDERVEIQDIVPIANTPISGTRLNLTYSEGDVTHILQDDSNIIVGGVGVDKVGSISQTDIRGKDGKGKIEFIHDNSLKFSVETKNTTFIGKEGSGHNTAFTYGNDISGKYSYQGTSVGPLGIRVGGGHNFSIENTDITSSGTLVPQISPYRNIFYMVELNSSKVANTSTTLTLDNKSSIKADSERTGAVMFVKANANSSLKFINEGTITATKQNSFITNFLNISNSEISSFINKGNILLDGEGASVVLDFIGIAGHSFVKNEGTISLKGKNNRAVNISEQGSTRLNGTTISVFQFNKPIIIEGEYSTGFFFRRLSRNRKFENIINGNLEKSFFNVELFGKKNTGMRIGTGTAQNGEVKFQNFRLKSINGEGNHLVRIQKQSDIKFLVGGEHQELTIEGGDKNFGFYVQESTGVKNEADFSIKGSSTGASKNAIGIVSTVNSEVENTGKLTISGDRVKAFYALKNGKIVNHGDIIFNGSTTDTDKGSVGMYAKQGGKIESNGVVNITVSNPKSVGLFAENKGDDSTYLNEAEITISKANILAKNGAFNIFANKGGKITLGQDVKLTTEKNSLTFYTAYTPSNPGGKIIFQNSVTARIKKGGSAFYYDLASHPIGTFNFSTWYANNFIHHAGSKLKLELEEGGRALFLANGNLALSGVPTNFLSGGNLEIQGNNYITTTLIDSTLNLDKDINLDDNNNEYKKLEILHSSITNSKTMTGSKKGEIAIAQENRETHPASKITLKNTAKIILNGEDSIGMYAKRGKIENIGEISVGKKSVATYLVEDNLGNLAGDITNSGTIILGEKSTGILYKAETSGTHTGIIGGIFNQGKIKSLAKNAVGMNFNGSLISKKMINEANGEIELLGESSIGMYATGNGNYTVENLGKITIGSSSDISSPGIGIYTNNSNALIQNTGNIIGKEKSIGIYGYAVTTGTTSNITVGKSGTGIYSLGKNLQLQGSLTIGKEEAKGVVTTGNHQIVNNNFSNIVLEDNSSAFVNLGNQNQIVSNTPNVSLKNKNIFLYSEDKNGSMNNYTKLTSYGNANYGMYTSGSLENHADLDFSQGFGNIAIYSIGQNIAKNSAKIKVGESKISEDLYSIGMAAGYYDKANKQSIYMGNIENTGTIEVTGKHGIGMYASGKGSTAINRGEIHLLAKNSIGMFLEQGAEGINYGKIIATPDAVGAIGAVTINKAIFKNYGTIQILAPNGVGVITGREGKLKEYASISSSEADGSSNISAKTRTRDVKITGSEKIVADGKVQIILPSGKKSGEIKVDNMEIPIVEIDTNVSLPNARKIEKKGEITDYLELKEEELGKSKGSVSKIGMYIDTSGVNYTNPIEGLHHLSNEAEVDLLIGTEATQYTNSKAIKIKKNILSPYNTVILSSPQIQKWNVYSASLTWIGHILLNDSKDQIKDAYLAKIPYTVFSKEKDVYNFADGLEQRYSMNSLNSKEKKLFNKLNDIGENESVLLTQAFDEMMGHQYANVQQRINATGNILDKEFDYLRNEWQTVSKDSNKVKTFGTNGEYKTDTAGVIDYKYNAYGVAYVHENEDIKLGRSVGWYAGIVQNTIKFKDIGNSKEEQLQGKVGLLKSVPFDDNNSLNWTISGDIFAGYNKMKRRFLVVDEVFNAKAKYYNYGISIKNEIGKEFRLSESFTLRPYVALDLEYGRISKIREKSGEVKLEVKQNDYISVKPEVGAELAFKHYFGAKTFKAGLGVAYENELGRVAKGKNKARVKDTNADWFNIRSEKEDRKGNVKFDLNLSLDNQRYGVTANVGYDTKGENMRGGLGLRVIF